MSELTITQSSITPAVLNSATPFGLKIEFLVNKPLAFDVDISLDIFTAPQNTLVSHAQLRAASWDVSWLPGGSYTAHALAARPNLPAGDYVAQVALWHHEDNIALKCAASALAFCVSEGAGDGPQLSWQLESREDTTPIHALSWKQGTNNWFYKHFDHAARTTISYLLGDSPLLKGRILDVGCGDGITDLGIALRKRPIEFIGIDPFRGYEHLPDILKQAHIPIACMPDCLRFMAADANAIPFSDDHFDVVISWGSVEHIKDGYSQALREIRRVLKPQGLLMIHPGLFYSDVGNHLGEFRFAREEPYVHLKHSRDWLREQVLKGDIERMDRSGHVATPAEYWQWFTELNPITVAGFEKELRDLDFVPWRVALRTQDRVDYTAELQGYSFVDLAVAELYISAVNNK